MTPEVTAFFDEATYTVSYVVKDPASNAAAVVDSVLDFDYASGRTDTRSADAIVDYVRENGLEVGLAPRDPRPRRPPVGRALPAGEAGRQDRHRRQDHRRAGHLRQGLQRRHRVPSATAASSTRSSARATASTSGSCGADVLHTPGHTPACLTYVIGDAAFVGDTLFMPDFGTARCDFPGGSAETLYASIQKILALPDETTIFVGHDYKAPGREVYAWETTRGRAEGAERPCRRRRHGGGLREDAQERDATLADAQAHHPVAAGEHARRAGCRPPTKQGGTVFLKVPVNKL